MTEYANLTADDQEAIQAELLHTQGGEVSEKLLRTLEADIYSRELLGMNVARQKDKLAKLKAKKK